MDVSLFPVENDWLVLCTFPSISKVSALKLMVSWVDTYLIFLDTVKLLLPRVYTNLYSLSTFSPDPYKCCVLLNLLNVVTHC